VVAVFLAAGCVCPPELENVDEAVELARLKLELDKAKAAVEASRKAEAEARYELEKSEKAREALATLCNQDSQRFFRCWFDNAPCYRKGKKVEHDASFPSSLEFAWLRTRAELCERLVEDLKLILKSEE
jgi:hypothetical protein